MCTTASAGPLLKRLPHCVTMGRGGKGGVSREGFGWDNGSTRVCLFQPSVFGASCAHGDASGRGRLPLHQPAPGGRRGDFVEIGGNIPPWRHPGALGVQCVREAAQALGYARVAKLSPAE